MEQQKKTYACAVCSKKFTQKADVTRHHTSVHAKIISFTCEVCGRGFSRKDNFIRHVASHQTMKRAYPFQDEQNNDVKKAMNKSVSDERMNEPIEVVADPSLIQESVEQSYVKQILDALTKEEAFLNEYRENFSSLRSHYREGEKQSTYTFRWENQAAPQWARILPSIVNRQAARFKINYSHSFLLFNRDTKEYRYFHASNNNARVLDAPVLINNPNDFDQFIKHVAGDDTLWQALRHRPDTKWTVSAIVSTTFYVDKIRDHPIGCCSRRLPDPVRNNKSIVTFENDKTHKNKPLGDNLCFFRCLALFRGTPIYGLERETRRLADQWGDKCGVKLSDIYKLENMFEINVQVYKYDLEKACLVPHLRSLRLHKQTMYVLLHERHFCYIKDINAATNSFACENCGSLWKHLGKLHRHQQTCKGPHPEEKCVGGVYHPQLTPLEQVAAEGISVDTSFVYPFRATYDFESYFTPINRMSAKTTYVNTHVPMSVSVCSNVPGYTQPKCFVSTGDSKTLVEQMINYLEEIADTVYAVLLEAFKPVCDAITEKLLASDGDCKRLCKVHKAFDRYLRQLPVVGFNSGKYDINVIKPYLVRQLAFESEEDEAKPFGKGINSLIKKNNNFMNINTRKFRFLDVINYIAPGFSYSKYLKAYDVEEAKGFFPYEYVKHLDQLKETCLPPKEAFYSSLRDTHISDDDYTYCQQVWAQEHMKTFQDFLIWYNNKDVGPFIQALEKQTAFYKSLGVDMLKDAVSVSGLTLRYLFKSLPKDVYFSLINEKHCDLHTLLRDQIVGGPSIVFHRYHEKDLTHIRCGEKSVQRLLGYDANALYLYALMQAMPTEHPIRRRKENDFKPERVDKYGLLARQWLEWLSFTERKQITHKFNSKEHTLGDRHIPVDGWDGHTAYQFHGCLFHGHDCSITKGLTHNPVNDKPLAELRENTNEITTYLKEVVKVNVVEKWECEWTVERKNDSRIQHFLKKHSLLAMTSCLKSSPSKDDILDSVQNDKLFGLVQCDIHVPENLQPHFSEMPPIFKNVDVGKKDIGSHMKDFCENNKLLSQPRRTLIGSFIGKEILLTTPLLRWYMQHGLVVTDVQQVVEYKPKRCFREFGDTVSNARRQGDLNPTSSILADTFKLLGNSAYGKTLENLAKHHEVVYTDEPDQYIKKPLFRKLTELDETIYEVEMAKSKILWNLPLQIGYFVYQYAKLRMLEFHFDFIDKHIAREDYQLCEMDTDSLYFVISDTSLEKVIKPEMRRSFYEAYRSWFPSPVCDKHLSLFIRQKCADETCDVTAPCCKQRLNFDKRTPGLFKLEYAGDGIVALCSKTYCCFEDSDCKTAMKGLNKTLNQLTKEHYLKVLKSQVSGVGLNRGFRTDGKSMLTYEQERASLSYLYIKRKVLDDGVSTDALLL